MFPSGHYSALIFSVSSLLALTHVVCGQDPFLPPPGVAKRYQAPANVPEPLRKVHGQWETDAQGHIVGVDFCSTEGVHGLMPTLEQFRHLTEMPYLTKVRHGGDGLTD